MIFVDSNVFMYAAGDPHPRQEEAREFFDQSRRNGTRLFTSAEVLQELIHVYMRQHRLVKLNTAMAYLDAYDVDVWPLEEDDVREAYRLTGENPNLQARDLCHLASCTRRGISAIQTFDRALALAAHRIFGSSIF